MKVLSLARTSLRWMAGMLTVTTVLAVVAVASIPIGLMAALWWSTFKSIQQTGFRGNLSDNAAVILATTLDTSSGYIVFASLATVISAVILGWAWKACQHQDSASRC